MNFDTFAFHPQIKAGITAAGYATPTSIQLQTIPAILSGKDVLGLAQTGTGKTAAFALPILQQLMKGPRGKLRALILSPTRELAEQTHTSIQKLGRQTGLRSLTLYGGVSAQPQLKGLREGVEIGVACPGRLLDLMGQGVVDLSHIEILVLDEADQMFDMGFLPSVRRIIAALPAKHQSLLFSATMPAEIRSLASEMMHDPQTVEIEISRPVSTIHQALYPVEQTRKTEMLLELLRQAGAGQVLVFTRTKHRAKKLAVQLVQAGVSATSLQGNLSQSQRQDAMNRFRTGRAKVMVATDIAARGIDVSQVTHVINFDMPDTADAYTHRIGRTGRMERLGTAFTLITGEDLAMVRTIERILGKPLERRSMAGFEVTLVETAPPPRGGNGRMASERAQTRPVAGQGRERRGPRPQGMERPQSSGRPYTSEHRMERTQTPVQPQTSARPQPSERTQPTERTRPAEQTRSGGRAQSSEQRQPADQVQTSAQSQRPVQSQPSERTHPSERTQPSVRQQPRQGSRASVTTPAGQSILTPPPAWLHASDDAQPENSPAEQSSSSNRPAGQRSNPGQRNAQPDSAGRVDARPRTHHTDQRNASSSGRSDSRERSNRRERSGTPTR